MKLIWLPMIMLAAALSLPAQQGRGGSPLAWNDTDKDGICDVTGQAVGTRSGRGRWMARQGARPAGRFAAGRGRGWAGGGWGRGRGRGFGWRQSAQPAAPATQPAQPADSKPADDK